MVRGKTIEELLHAFKQAWADGDVGVVILTGAGTKAFCVGGDQMEFMQTGSYGTSENGRWEIEELHMIIRQIPKPVIRSEAHTSELQSLMRISYAVFCLKNT